ncbi:MAG TPA: alpha/beta-type small acid-soluble spore protein [Bacilli bacterium]
MSRKRSRRLIVPEAEQSMEIFKGQVMRREGYMVNPNQPGDVKYSVADAMNIPLKQGYNGHLSTESAGKVGGQIGGAMVREMVRMAKQQLAQNSRKGG